MVSVLASSVVDRGYKIGIHDFSTNHAYAALRRKSKDWLSRNQDNVAEWGDKSSVECCFSELALVKSTSKRVSLKQSGPRHHLI